MADGFIDFVASPSRFAEKIFERFGACRDTPFHQLLAVSLHKRFQPGALTEFVVLGAGEYAGSGQVVFCLTELLVAQYDRDTGRSDRQRSDRTLDRVA